MRVKNPGNCGDVCCRFRFGVNVFELDADSLFLRQPRALGVLNVQQLGFDQAGNRPVFVHGRSWRNGDAYGCVFAGEHGFAQSNSFASAFAFSFIHVSFLLRPKKAVIKSTF